TFLQAVLELINQFGRFIHLMQTSYNKSHIDQDQHNNGSKEGVDDQNKQKHRTNKNTNGEKEDKERKEEDGEEEDGENGEEEEEESSFALQVRLLITLLKHISSNQMFDLTVSLESYSNITKK